MAGKRPSPKAVGLLIAVFVLGGVVGGLGTYLVGHMRNDHRRQHIVDRLSQQLRLTPSQLKQVKEILAEGHKQWVAIYEKSQEEARPKYDALHTQIRSRIRAILTPDQQAKFDDFLKRLDAERKAREKRQGRRH